MSAGHGSRRRRGIVAVVGAMLAGGTAVAACSLIDPLDDLTGAVVDASSRADVRDSAAESNASADADANPPDSTPPRCNESPYTGGRVTEGFLCGVGACRKRLTGADCRFEQVEGGTRSPCATAFPPEVAGDGIDNNCNGVVDDGYPSATPDAGFDCRGCAFGTAVQRLANGNLETAGGAQNRAAHRNTTDCVNSDRCQIGAASWVRNVSMMTCTDFCASMGGTCKPACSTGTGQCKAAAVGTGFGTYASDYNCVVPPGHPNGVDGTPLTGDCNKRFPGVIDPSADFNLSCCCEL